MSGHRITQIEPYNSKGTKYCQYFCTGDIKQLIGVRPSLALSTSGPLEETGSTSISAASLTFTALAGTLVFF